MKLSACPYTNCPCPWIPSPMQPASNQAAFSVFVLVQQLPLVTSGIGAPEPIDSNRYVRRTAEIWKKTWNDHEISEVIQFCGVMFFLQTKKHGTKAQEMMTVSMIDYNESSFSHRPWSVFVISQQVCIQPLSSAAWRWFQKAYPKAVPIIPVPTVMKFMKIILYIILILS